MILQEMYEWRVNWSNIDPADIDAANTLINEIFARGYYPTNAQIQQLVRLTGTDTAAWIEYFDGKEKDLNTPW